MAASMMQNDVTLEHVRSMWPLEVRVGPVATTNTPVYKCMDMASSYLQHM